MGLISSLLGNAGSVSPAELNNDYNRLLIPGEQIQIGFKLIRDTMIFTTKRLILINKQGITGSKVEMKSLPYKSISRFSVESAGLFDLDAELKIWISSEQEPSVNYKFNKKVNIYEVQQLLASHLLGSGA